MTHLHQFDVHPNPKFDDMAHCTICRWGVSKNAIVRSMYGYSYPKIKSEQLTDALTLDLFHVKETK